MGCRLVIAQTYAWLAARLDRIMHLPASYTPRIIPSPAPRSRTTHTPRTCTCPRYAFPAPHGHGLPSLPSSLTCPRYALPAPRFLHGVSPAGIHLPTALNAPYPSARTSTAYFPPLRASLTVSIVSSISWRTSLMPPLGAWRMPIRQPICSGQPMDGKS